MAAEGNRSSSGSSDEHFRHADGAATPHRTAEDLLLEQILGETEDYLRGSFKAPLDHEDLNRLRQVAERHRGKEFSVSPIATEMVEAVLADSLSRVAGSGDALRSVAASVAKTLCSDPIAGTRLAQLWKRISGGEL